jgi:FkbM family methyltransferase
MFRILATNLGQLSLSAEARNSAVSNWSGFGELCSPKDDPSPSALYVAEKPTGSVVVTTLDELPGITGGGLIVKIDVEGQELGVIQGALGLLNRVDQFVVGFEAHPKVVKRTRVDPLECIRLLNKVRKCTTRVSEFPDTALQLDKPFFDQIPSPKCCNIICRSLP